MTAPLARTKSCSLSEDAITVLEKLPGLFRKTDGGFLSEYVFREQSHALTVLHGLNEQRKSNTLCDVVICVEDQEFPCHRNILAACSPYFLAMFTGDMKESKEREVKIDGMSPDIMKQLIDFAYTADISITQENAQQLLSAANLVQIHTIIQACCNFLESEMDPSNCLGIHCFAEAHVCDELSDKARQYVIEHFSEVARQEEILLLPKDKLIEFIKQDDLHVESEEIVLDAILLWVKHDPKHRVQQLADVFQYVRLPLVSPYYLFDKVDTDQLLMSAPGCRPYLDEAMKYHILKDRRIEMSSPRMVPRRCMAVNTVVYITGGEIYNRNYLNCVEGYSLDGGTWVKLKELPFSRCHHCSVVSEDSHLYIAGGYNKEQVVVSNVMRYERYLDKWIKVASMNVPRAKFGMAALDGYIYAIGGYDGTLKLSTVERYCPHTNKWTYVTSLPFPISTVMAASLNGHLYCAGGVVDPSNYCVDLFQRYDPSTDKWEQLCPLPSARTLNGLVAVRGKLYAVGGKVEHVYQTKELLTYSLEEDTWTSLPKLFKSRYDPDMELHQTKCYRCGEDFGHGHLGVCKGINRCCFNCKKIGHLSKMCRAAKQPIVSAIRVVARKSEKKKERDNRRRTEFHTRREHQAELPFSGLTEPEFLALDFSDPTPIPFYLKQKHTTVAEKVTQFNENIQKLQTKNDEHLAKIEIYKKKNDSLEKKIRTLSDKILFFESELPLTQRLVEKK